MSYQIDVASVTAVLLADGWHKVKSRTFGIEPYAYGAPVAEDEGKPSGNRGRKKKTPVVASVEQGPAPTLGARWTKPGGEVIACPVGSVLALRCAGARKR